LLGRIEGPLADGERWARALGDTERDVMGSGVHRSALGLCAGVCTGVRAGVATVRGQRDHARDEPDLLGLQRASEASGQ
jgi:hypothetical protein